MKQNKMYMTKRMNKSKILSGMIMTPIKERWSPMKFSPKPIDESVFLLLFEAARWAPSSYNEQPWRFILGIKGESTTYDKIFNGLKEKNQVWAISAPVLMLICCKLDFTHKSVTNICSHYDTGAAVAFLVLQAQQLGVFSRQIAGIERDILKQNFEIPEDYAPICAMALGYLKDTEVGSDKESQKGGIRERNQFNEFVFENEWGNPFGFINESVD